MASSRYLLVSRVGGQSLHSEWVSPDHDRGFDLLISAYDPSVPKISGEGIFFEHRAGRKVAGYASIFADHADLLRRYDYVALFDDDLSIDGRSIGRLFEIASRYKLKIAQPSLHHLSHFTYGCLLQHDEFLLRYVNYIEMMCPIFRTDILFDVLPLFGLGYESGIDLIWSAWAHRHFQDFAVIDAVPILHTRPVGDRRSDNGFGPGRGYEHDIYGILHRFGLPWLPCLPYAAVRADGRLTRNRVALLLAAAKLAFAIPKRFPIKGRWRPIAVYWNHLLRRRPQNLSIANATGSPVLQQADERLAS